MKKCFLLLLACLLAAMTQAQFLRTASYIDQMRLSFGFLLGANRSSLLTDRLQDFATANLPAFAQGSLASIDPQAGFGLNLGMVSTLKLNDHFHLRFTPGFSFNAQALRYVYFPKDPSKASAPAENKIIDKPLNTILLELPVWLKLRATRHKDFRIYAATGIKYSYDLTSGKRLDDSEFAPNSDERFVKLKPGFFSWEVAIGLELYNAYFKFTPELRFSRSFNNLLGNPFENKFTDPLQGLFTEVIHLNFYFE